MNVVIAYSLLIFGLGLNYVFSIFVARALGTEGFGDYTYTLYLFNILSLVAVIGLDEAALRFLPQAQQKNGIKSVIQTGAVFSAIVFFCLYLLFINMALDGIKSEVSIAFAFCLPLFVILTVNAAILQAEYIVGPRMLFRHGLEPVVKISLLAIFLANSYLILAPVYSIFIALLITNIAMLFIYRNRLLLYGYQPISHHWRALVRFVAPMSMNNIINIVSSRLDVIILGGLASSIEVGHYSAAFQTAAILSIVLQGIETVYAPLYSKAIGQNDFVQLANYLKRSLRWTMIISSPLIIVFLIYPEIALLPFGKEFNEARDVFVILCMGQLLNLATGSVNILLILLGKTRVVLFNSSVYGVVIALGVYFGASLEGLAGAAVSVGCAIFLINIFRIIFLYRITGITPFSNAYAKALVVLLFVITAGYFFKNALGISGVVLLPVMYVITLIAFGIHIEDKVTVIRIGKILAGLPNLLLRR